MCSVKKGVPKSFTNFTGKHCVGEIFKNTYFEEHMQMAASIKSSHDWPYFLKILDYYFYKTLSEKCPNTEFFPVFSFIRIEYGDLQSKSPYSVRI